EIQEPRAHHASLAPDLGHLREIERELLLVLHDAEALGERLHHAVLDAVVHHLREVPAADRADVPPAGLRARRERLEHGAQPLGRRVVAADHEAVTVRQPPHAAARTAVHERHVARSATFTALHAVLVVAVAAVDDRVAAA